jgi:hypothetical protein
MSDTPAAGWYPDPEDATQQRYWDGTQWTEHRAPLSGGPAAGAQPPAAGQGQQDWSAGGGFSSGGGFSTGGGFPAGGPGQPGGGQVAYGAAPIQNQKALWALILGILGLVCCGIFTAVPAIILGNNAKKEIAASGGMQSGQGMAQAGFILGIVGVVLSILLVLFYVLAFATTFSSGF